MGDLQLSCFLCSNSTVKYPLVSEYDCQFTDFSLLSNNLNVIFLLRKVLKVPGILLESKLRECGDYPEDWIILCDQCTKLIRKARDLDQEIQRIQKELTSIQKQVLGKIRAENIQEERKAIQTDGNDEEAYRRSSWLFEKKIREFVKNYKYNLLDEDGEESEPGFVQGDKLARYLDIQGQDSSAAAIVLVEKPSEDDQHEIKVEQEISRPMWDRRRPSAGRMDKEVSKFLCKFCGKEFNLIGNLSTHVKFVHLSREDEGQSHQDEMKDEPESPSSTPMSPPAAAAYDAVQSPNQIIDEDDPGYDPELAQPNENLVKSRKRKVKAVKRKSEKGSHQCSDCDQKFNSQFGLSRHLNVVHGKRFQVTCPLCSKDFQSERLLNKHVLGKHKDDPIAKKVEAETGLFLRKCSVVGCGVRFMKQVDHDRHMEMIHGGNGEQTKDKMFKCKYCERGFWDKYKCRRHEKIHEEKGKVRGGRGTWSTARKVGKVTSKVVKAEDPSKSKNTFKCDNCTKTFKWARNWSEHLWDKHGKRDIICPGLECGKIFKDDLVEFQKHWKICGRRKSIEKKERKKRLGTRTKDKQLSSRKSTGKDFICGICGHGFISAISLYGHKRKYHRVGKFDEPVGWKLGGGKPETRSEVLCNFCGKQFSRKCYLDVHVKFVHDKKFSLSCHLCGLGMACRENLNEHLLGMHREDPVTKQLEEEEGLKLRKCPVVGCTAKFLRQGALDKHVEKMHGGGGGGGDGVKKEERFKCKYCGKGFWIRERLKRHEEMHEGKGREDWKCEICGKGFSTKHYLRYHELWTHKLSKKFQKKSV